ncbi:MAG: TraR/DksA C4-type zinc finger protein [Pseudonocardiaceae bacterium]
MNYVEVVDGVTCIECGDEILEERAQLGYRYCTKVECQAVHYRGIAITAIGVNKSADSFIVADEDEIRRRGEAGEFAKKDTALGLGYRARPAAPSAPSAPAGASSLARVPKPRPAPPRRPWTAEQEKIVRLYHGMGLNPRQIAQRARENVPRLRITERLATQIMSALPRR